MVTFIWFHTTVSREMNPIEPNGRSRHTWEDIATCWSVTIDVVRIGNRIYWTLWYSAWLHFTVHYYTHTSVHSHVFIALVGSGFQRRTFPFLSVPELSPCLSYQLLTANSSQRLNPSSSLTDYNSSQVKSSQSQSYLRAGTHYNAATCNATVAATAFF
jgi:hypothetical protein